MSVTDKLELLPHQGLLVSAAVFNLAESEEKKLIALIAQGFLDWGSLLEDAHNHGLIPVLCKHLENINWQGVPLNFKESFSQKAQNIAGNNLRLAGEMVKILDLFQQHNIKCVPIKGPTLANILYGDVGMRQFHDLDLFVKLADVNKAERLLISIGYAPNQTLSPLQKKKYFSAECEYNFTHSVSRLLVEIHWGFVPAYIGYLRTYEYFEQTHGIQKSKDNIPTFSSEEMCLALLVHNGLKHGFDRLCWYMDVVAFWERDDFDWNKFIHITRAEKFENLLGVTVQVLQNLCKFSPPPSVASRIKKSKEITRYSQELTDKLFIRVQREPPLLKQIKYQLFFREGMYLKYFYITRLLFTPGTFDWKWIALPDKLYGLYYLLRPVRLLLGYFRG